MSGTAALSAAKNRRSGNEVKFNGQSKSLPPPQDTRQQQNSRQAPPPQQQNGRQTTQQNNKQQQQGQQQQGQQCQPGQMPHPIEILKSHELRLQDIEGSGMAQDFSSHIDDYVLLKSEHASLKSEHASLKSDYALLKTDYSLFKNSVKFFEKNSTAVLERSNNNIQSEQTITGLKDRIEELSALVINLSKHLEDVSNSVNKHSSIIDVLTIPVRICDDIQSDEDEHINIVVNNVVDDTNDDVSTNIVTNNSEEQNINLEITPLI